MFIEDLFYGCTTWILTKYIEKKLDGNYPRILQAMLNKSRKKHSTKQQLYGHLLPISRTIQIRWTRHEGHCWRRKDKFISDFPLWTPWHGCASVGQSVGIYLQQLLLTQDVVQRTWWKWWMIETNGERERERVREISASSTWWWWWWW